MREFAVVGVIGYCSASITTQTYLKTHDYLVCGVTFVLDVLPQTIRQSANSVLLG